MKHPKVTIKTFSLRELASDSGVDVGKLRAFQKNPFAASGETIAKIVGCSEGEEAGREFVFSLHVRGSCGEIEVLAGSSLFVSQKYRRSGLGMDLPELRWQYSPSKVALGASLSQMALPVHQLLDYSVFLLPRYIMLWKSRAVVEMKLHGLLSKTIGFIADCGIGIYASLLKVMALIALIGIKVDEVCPDDDKTLAVVAELIENDKALFSEVHDARWLKWHMTESFSKDGPLRLFVAKRKNEIIGFYMDKKRFHETASHRGFKNVWLGSIMEWQMKSGFYKKLKWLLVRAALALKAEGVDAVEIPSADRNLHCFFRRIGWRCIGESNFVIKAGEGSSLFENEAMKIVDNWRLRPAMGDAGMS